MPVFGDPFANPVYPTDVAPATPTPPLVTPAAYFPGAGPLRPGFQPAMAQEPVPDVPAYADPIAMPVSGGMGAMPMQVQTTTEMPLVDPSLQKQFAENERVRQKAQADMLKAMDQQAAAQASKDAMIAEKQREETARLLAKQEAAREEVERREATARQAEEEYKQAKVDPDRWYEGSTGKRIAAALIAGAGAFAASMTGGRNFAGEIIDQAIERDIEAQKMAIAKKKELSGDAKKLWEVAQARYENAEEFVRAQGWRSVEADAQAMANKASNAVQKQNFLMQAADANQKYLQHMAALQPKTQVTAVAGGGAAGGMSASEKARVEKESDTALEWASMKASVMGEFDKAGEIKFIEGAAPQFLGSRKGELGAKKANIAAQIIGRVPGIKSDADFNNIVVPLLPNASDTEYTVKKKREAFQSFLDAQAPAAYLKRAGIDKTKNQFPSFQESP